MSVQTRTKPALFDLAGRPLDLGSELGSGGEGAVYEIRDRPDVVVKRYHKPLDAAKSAKIVAMAKLGNERLLKLTAWPTEPIQARSGTGPIAGFIMPKISGHKQAFSLYGPKLRLQEFPTAGWQFLIRSAENAARAFKIVHENGQVIGDVNHGNLLVGSKATVQLIDCDSYQISINGFRWFCEVGTPTHQPPELQNIRTYKGVVRTPNHDNFGLAVIAFQMLFMARHPFSGRFLGTGEMPMERAISEYRFAYGANAAAMQMQPPPASLGLNGVTRDVAVLFERAFSRQGSEQNGRPRADEWVTALQDLERHLKTCGVNPAHQFLDTLRNCPWCEIEAATGVPLFQVVLAGSAQTGLSIAVLWAKLDSVPNPGPPPALPRVDGRTVTLSPAGLDLQQATFGTKLAAGFLALIGISSRIQFRQKQIETRAADARDRWQNISNSWDSYNSSKAFDDLLSYLQNLRSQYDALAQKRLQELQKLESNRYAVQLNAHLDRCRISHARIAGVGAAKKATLQSYSIETAADIVDHRVLAVPGFGPALLSNLKRWRDQQQRRFVFDPSKGVDLAAKNAVERQILTEKLDLERKLNEGLAKLIVGGNHILTRRRTLLAQAEQAANNLAQAEADLRASAAILPVLSWKPAIAALGAISIGGLILVSHLGNRSSEVTPGPYPGQPEQPNFPPHVEKDAGVQLHPQDGYDWSDSKHASVRWMPGKTSREYPHVIASNKEGEWQPGDGYNWVDLTNPKNKSVKWVPGIASDHYPNVVAAAIEGQWRPADGYTWMINPHRPDDMRVKPTPRPEDQLSTIVPAKSFQQGLADRTEWEQWVSALSGDFRRGAEWWAKHRSLRNPGSCSWPAATSQEFITGCEAAKARLTPKDIRRKSDPEYYRGWNDYAGVIKPPAGPDLQGSPIGQGATEIPRDSETGPADRLNRQERKRLQGQ